MTIRLAVLGDPLAHTRSPDLHRAALAALALTGESHALRTSVPELPARLAELAARGFRGVNLTHPLKEAVLPHLARLSEDARRARSVNTVVFDEDGWWGDTTDGAGFVDLIDEFGRTSSDHRVVLLGAGGAARSLALAIDASGCDEIVVSARHPETAAAAWNAIPAARLVRWRSRDEALALASATMVVNATPITGTEDPVPLAAIAIDALIVDLVYGVTLTPWVVRARAEGRTACDGLGLLVHQARYGLSKLLGRPVPIAALADAVGWPR